MRVDWGHEFLTLGKLLLAAAQLAFWGAVICFAIIATDTPHEWAVAIKGWAE